LPTTNGGNGWLRDAVTGNNLPAILGPKDISAGMEESVDQKAGAAHSSHNPQH
jgi:hypothetical protein